MSNEDCLNNVYFTEMKELFMVYISDKYIFNKDIFGKWNKLVLFNN